MVVFEVISKHPELENQIDKMIITIKEPDYVYRSPEEENIVNNQTFKWRRFYNNSSLCRQNKMKGNLNIYYDEDGDFLEINIGEYAKGIFKDIGEGISERIDEKTGKVTGIAIMSFRKRTEKLNNLKIKLPLKIEISS